MNANLNTILGVELICAVQGIEFRAPLTTSAVLAEVIHDVRNIIPAIEQDRYLAPDLAAAAAMIANGFLLEKTDLPAYVMGGAR
jgi:histidine ammonia-lyase